MPIAIAQTSGNWSSAATWFDGYIPQAGDFVFANNFTVTIDQDFTVERISVSSYAGARANPNMSSNSSPSGTASASSNGSNAWIAFDGSVASTGNAWVSTAGSGPTGWVAYQFPSTRRMVRYSLTASIDSTNTNQNPTAWEWQGSDDGITWTTLQTVTGQSLGPGSIYDSGVLTQPNSYLRYRINITASGAGATQTRVGELSFFEYINGARTASIGGNFLASSPRTINLQATTPLFHGNNIPVLTVNHSGASPFVLNAANTITGSFSSGVISHINTGALTITCPSMGGSGSNSGNTLIRSGSGTLNINSVLNGASSNASNVTLSNTGTGTINVVGNIVSGSGVNSAQVIVSTQGDINVTGNVFGGTGAGVTGISLSGGTVVVNGTVTGGTATAINHSSTVTVNGNVNTIGSAFGVSSSVGGTTNVIGNATAGASGAAIYLSNNAHTLNFTGNIINNLSRQAIVSTTLRLSDSLPSFWQAATVTNAAKTFYTEDTFPNSPAALDVRSGTTYGPGLASTGTLIVPSPSNVVAGVPTDNTVGTYSTTPTLIATEIFTKLLSNSDFNTAGSFGKLVKDNLDATVSSRSTQTSVDSIPTNPLLTTDSRLNNLDATVSSRLASASYTAPDNTTIGTINTKIGTPVSTVSSDIASVKSDTNGLRTDYTTSRASNLDNLDATVSSRLASASYVAPANSDIAAIKAKTDNLPSDPASETTVNTRLASSSYTAPDNATIGTINTKLGTPVSSVSSDIAAVKSDTASIDGKVDVTLSTRATQTSVNAIPTNPLLTTDSRLDNLDATISSRLASASYVAPDNSGITAIKAKTDNLPSDPADNSDILGAISAIPSAPSASSVASAVRTELTTELGRIDVATSTRLASASYVAPANSDIAAIKAKTDNLPSDPADNSDILSAISSIPSAPSASSVASAVRTELTVELDRIDVDVSSRLASSSYTAPDNSSITAIKAKTDNLPADPASEATVNTRLAAAAYTAPDNTTISTINTKLGTPVSSVSSDIAAVKSDTSSIDGKVDVTLSTRSSQSSVDAIPTNPLLTTDIRLNNLDATISSRLAASSYVAPDNSGIAAIKAKTDNLPSDPADNSEILGAIAAIPAGATPEQIADAVRTELTVELDRIDVDVSSRLASGSYTAPDNTSIAAIKAKTDNLPADPASNTNVNTKTEEIKQNTDLIPAII
jgi:hypothetical protein